MNAQKEKIFEGSHKLPPTHEKVCNENESRIRHAHKNVIHGRKLFITSKQKMSKNDLCELLGNDCGYNEGTICIVNG